VQLLSHRAEAASSKRTARGCARARGGRAGGGGLDRGPTFLCHVRCTALAGALVAQAGGWWWACDRSVEGRQQARGAAALPSEGRLSSSHLARVKRVSDVGWAWGGPSFFAQLRPGALFSFTPLLLCPVITGWGLCWCRWGPFGQMPNSVSYPRSNPLNDEYDRLSCSALPGTRPSRQMRWPSHTPPGEWAGPCAGMGGGGAVIKKQDIEIQMR
jgi:hypothetical protein